MTKVDIAEMALEGIARTEREGGAAAAALGETLRAVVAAFLSNCFPAVHDGVDVDTRVMWGLMPLYQNHIVDLRHRGLDHLPDPLIEKARREIQEEQQRQREAREMSRI